MSPDELSTTGNRGQGERARRMVRLSDRDGSGSAVDRYEPINLQIGHSDLVSVLDSLFAQGTRAPGEQECGTYGCELNA